MSVLISFIVSVLISFILLAGVWVSCAACRQCLCFRVQCQE